MTHGLKRKKENWLLVTLKFSSESSAVSPVSSPKMGAGDSLHCVTREGGSSSEP